MDAESKEIARKMATQWKMSCAEIARFLGVSHGQARFLLDGKASFNAIEFKVLARLLDMYLDVRPLSLDVETEKLLTGKAETNFPQKSVQRVQKELPKPKVRPLFKNAGEVERHGIALSWMRECFGPKKQIDDMRLQVNADPIEYEVNYGKQKHRFSLEDFGRWERNECRIPEPIEQYFVFFPNFVTNEDRAKKPGINEEREPLKPSIDVFADAGTFVKKAIKKRETGK